MKIPKEARRQARELFRASFTNDAIDDRKVRGALEQLAASRPRHTLAIATTLERLVRLEVERRTARVQSATPLEPPLTNAVRAGLQRTYGQLREVQFAVSPQLIGGLRIQVGSDVWDGSLAGRLRALAEAL